MILLFARITNVRRWSPLKKLETLCEIKLGTVLSRVKGKEGEGQLFSVISVKAMLGEEVPMLEKLDPTSGQLVQAEEGDVIVSLTQPNAFVITEKEAGWIIPSTFVCLKIVDKTKLNPYYLQWFLENSHCYKKQIHILKNQGSETNFIKVNDLKNIGLDVPPMEHQEKMTKLMMQKNREKELYKKKISLLETFINEQGNQWIKENQNGK